jgi:hypothetical protein
VTMGITTARKRRARSKTDDGSSVLLPVSVNPKCALSSQLSAQN